MQKKLRIESINSSVTPTKEDNIKCTEEAFHKSRNQEKDYRKWNKNMKETNVGNSTRLTREEIEMEEGDETSKSWVY